MEVADKSEAKKQKLTQIKPVYLWQGSTEGRFLKLGRTY